MLAPELRVGLTGLADEDLHGCAGRALTDDIVGRQDHFVAPVFLQICKGEGTGSAGRSPAPWGDDRAFSCREACEGLATLRPAAPPTHA